ncbi:hypothetical protein AVEN_81700-1 [Araneus ventricosus]|uniref:Uncharacterized protein n=1 Tax=Araneus ventricosus TaxID=182803 RepID=A0A4Y2WXM4_ARAVE|nr:hypothetical protein AVEN_81700-1 [Araneus ventricosus]
MFFTSLSEENLVPDKFPSISEKKKYSHWTILQVSVPRNGLRGCYIFFPLNMALSHLPQNVSPLPCDCAVVVIGPTSTVCHGSGFHSVSLEASAKLRTRMAERVLNNLVSWANS